jgi:molybdopterin converting factor small subunit
MATVIIPTPLRKFTNSQSRLQIQATDVDGLVQELTQNFPDLKKHLLDEQGKLRSFVNVFLGEDDIRDLQAGATPLNPEAVVSIIPAIAGGIY